MMNKHGASIRVFAMSGLVLLLLLPVPASASHETIAIWLSNRSGEQIYYSQYLDDARNTKDWKAYLVEPYNGMPSSGTAQVRVRFGTLLRWLPASNWPATQAHPWHKVRVPAYAYDVKCWAFVPGPRLVNDPETCRRLYKNPKGRVAPGHSK